MDAAERRPEGGGKRNPGPQIIAPRASFVVPLPGPESGAYFWAANHENESRSNSGPGFWAQKWARFFRKKTDFGQFLGDRRLVVGGFPRASWPARRGVVNLNLEDSSLPV